MRNFTYRSLDEKDNIEAVLRQRKKKVNRQQLIAGVIIFVICSLATLYAIDKSFYTEYDAYIHIDINKVRAPYDIYLDSVYVKPGDIVHVGDTLYSYYVLDWLVLEVNPNDEPSVLQNGRNLRLQYNDLMQRIQVLQVRIAELRKQIAVESHNISFGLSDNSHKMDLERELRESEALLSALRRQLAEVAKLLHDVEFGPRGPNRARKGGSQIYENPYSKSDVYDIRYNISNKDGFIANVQAPIGMIFFEKEDIIDMQHLDLKDNNLQVVAYVPVNLTSKIKDNMPAKVYVNDELSFQAHVLMTGVRSEDVPENLRSYFAKANKALIAILSIDEGQIIPFWSATAGLPVKVKIRNLFPWEDEPESHRIMLYEVGKGLILKRDGSSTNSKGSIYYDATNLPEETVEANHSDVTLISDISDLKDKDSQEKPSAKADKDHKAPEKQEKPEKQEQLDKPGKLDTAAKPVKSEKAQQTKKSQQAEKPGNEKPAAQAKAAGSAPEASVKGLKRYAVVRGVFNSEKIARYRLEQLGKNGFPNAGIFKNGTKWFVFFSSTDSKSGAYGEVNRLKNEYEEFGDAWVFDTNNIKKK